MLAYLDALLDALAVRDAAEAHRLLAHPLARLLPEEVRAEALGFADGKHDALAAPLHTLRHRRVTAELLTDVVPADQPETAEPRRVVAPALAPRRTRHQQMELPLSA